MKNTFGNQFSVTLFGESHGEAIGVTIDGLAAGIALDRNLMESMMEKRKAKGAISTQRKESDQLHIVSGYFNGFTTGTPLTILIENNNTQSNDYEKSKNRLRPSHADYTADEKYHGYQDYRGGGHFSGRMTAPLVAAGAIATQILKSKDILIGTHILQCKNIVEETFSHDEKTLKEEIIAVNKKEFPVLQDSIGQEMQDLIKNYASKGDSVGGILESCIYNLPTGVGEPFFDSIESTLSHLLFSIPALKGVQFGLGFEFANRTGSEANDAFAYDQKVITTTNHNGGINGGISNGMPVLIQCVIKPTPSIYREQDTIDRISHEPVKLKIEGRHDPAIIHRASVVVDSVLALGILDLLMTKQATDSQRETIRRSKNI